MRVSKYVVTSIDYIGPEGKESRLAVVPSESLPKEKLAKIRKGRLEELIRILKRGSK